MILRAFVMAFVSPPKLLLSFCRRSTCFQMPKSVSKTSICKRLGKRLCACLMIDAGCQTQDYASMAWQRQTHCNMMCVQL